ncbi:MULTISPECIES: MFS transporter [Ensifer]|nr:MULTISPECIES: MFS transporter [Ensifer]KDP71063.1 MFS transporter [Ensifer adhaerens]MBD9538038.1 MFS transporter [Ensifer sp. ENS04]QHG70690.1 MFS transporter [Ensifer adhaerens]SFG89869.1 Major Facilitator Superfamily protein [Ensifer sp. OV372]
MGAVATAAANDNRLASELEAAEAVDEDQHGETVIAPEPAPTPVPAPVEKGLLLSAVYVLGSVLLFLTQGLGMNLALANLTQVQGSLSATSIEAGWLSAAYMAPNVSLSIALVKIRAQYGLRRFAEISIAGFVVVSLMNVFVSDLHSAIVVRFISGIAAAPMSTLGFLYMLEAFPPARKLTVGLALALTCTTISAPVTRLISPTLIEYGQWHALYTLEMALALIALPIIYLLPLTPVPHAKVIQRMDILSYLLVAVAFGCLAVVLTMGRLYWWFEAPWLGVLLVVSIATLTTAVLIELYRPVPLIDVRWIASKEIVHFAAVLLIFRLVASEQSTVAANFYQQLGLQFEQVATLYWIILAAAIGGGLLCAALMNPGHAERVHILALGLLAAGAYMDSQATSLTRPEQMYLSQAMIASGTALFLPPAMARGFKAALAKGPSYILSFIVIFLFTQSIGSLIGSAAFGTFVTIREKFHSNLLAEQIVLSNPLVAQRVNQLSAAYAKVMGDKTLLGGEGTVLLSQQVTREAYILAYNDAFLLASAVALFALAGLLLHISHNWLRQRLSAPAPMPAT